MERLPLTERQQLASRVGSIQSACVAVSWAMDALAVETFAPDNSTKRFELTSGLGFILELMAGELDEVYDQLNGE